jgi:polar amino acid transport system permease protein
LPLPQPLDLLPPLTDGLGVTLMLTAPAALLAMAAALGAGLGRLSRRAWVRAPVRTYVEVFRGTSALVQLFWFYFALPLVGIELDAMTAGILVLGLNTGAYGSEIVRGAIRAVPRGQWDAAEALDLSRAQTLRFVILPQALLAMLPPAGNLLVELLKNTALVSLVTISDLTFQGQVLRAATLRSGEIFGLVLVLYFAVATLLVRGVRGFERRLARGRDVGALRA